MNIHKFLISCVMGFGAVVMFGFNMWLCANYTEVLIVVLGIEMGIALSMFFYKEL